MPGVGVGPTPPRRAARPGNAGRLLKLPSFRPNTPSASGGDPSTTTPSPAEPPFRRATPADAPAIRWLVLRELMNPLALHPDRFLVADIGGGKGLAAVGQMVPLSDGDGSEVRSVVVAPAARGAGLGTHLLLALLASAPPGPVWLTTLKSRLPFYQKHGFRVVGTDAAPSDMKFEVAAGTVVARLLGEELVLLRADRE